MTTLPYRIIPLGGLGEVGRNMTLYEYGDDILIVDCGLMFPDNNMPGIDYIIPDFQYLKDKRERVRGIIFTHGHEDHIGAVHHLLEEITAPIYTTPLTRGLLEVKLARNGKQAKAELNTVQAGETIQIGPFQIEFFHVSHSIPDAVGLGITTPAGLIVHTGDYKFDHTPVDSCPSDFAKLAEFSNRGVLALFADSTNSERPGWTPSESVVGKAFDDVFEKATGRIIIASFASLISRMQQVINCAVKYNRRLAFVGTSMVDNVKMARKLGYIEMPEGLQIGIDQALNLPEKDIVIMCTGSQGEPSSILGRLSTGRYHLFDVKQGDTVVLSSHPIPGNEENVYRTINRLFQRGADVVYEAIAPVHVSGHASQEEMKLLLNLVRPRFVVPGHGEIRHLRQHARLAEVVGIPRENIALLENGQSLEFIDGEMRLGARFPAPYVFVDGSSVGEVNHNLMKERESLAQDGVLFVNLVVDKTKGGLLREPEFVSHGYILAAESANLMEEARRRIVERAAKANGSLSKEVEQLLRQYLYNEVRRVPQMFVNVTKI